MLTHDQDAVADTLARTRPGPPAARLAAEPVTLLLDETPQRNHLRAMKLSRMTGGRAIPLRWQVYRPHALPMPPVNFLDGASESTCVIGR